MSLHTTIKDATKQAMREKDAVTLSTLRGLVTAFTNESVATGGTPQDELTDEQAMTVIKREANKRKDSIEQYTKGGRPELAESEKAELAVLKAYLPEMMSKEDIQNIAEAKKAELGIEDKSKMGVLIGAIMKETGGNADGADVKEIVTKLLS